MSQRDRFCKVRGVERLETRCVLSASGMFGGMHGPGHGPHDGPHGSEFGGPQGGFDFGRHDGPPRGYNPPPPAFHPEPFASAGNAGSTVITIVPVVFVQQQPNLRTPPAGAINSQVSSSDDLFTSLGGRGGGRGETSLQVSALTSLEVRVGASGFRGAVHERRLRFLPITPARSATTEETAETPGGIRHAG